jgi:hypothetical protein
MPPPVGFGSPEFPGDVGPRQAILPVDREPCFPAALTGDCGPQKVAISRDYVSSERVPEEGLEPPTRGL